MQNKNLKSLNEGLAPRPPIVVVMGHIDHGKTTLLDYIRKTSIATQEAGGITQHIGAYEVEYSPSTSSGPKKLTFLDTPGHEAFGKMRSRGADVADIAVLVVAADDGVKPQTKEALESINKAHIPFCVAINKIDKAAANPDKTKNELADTGVFLEERGGNVPYVEISAKVGTDITKLLETILLMAELENLSASATGPAAGVVIESHQDARRGITATLLIKNGAIKKGDFVVAGGATAKIKILESFNKLPIDSAGPSSPVVVVGFDAAPDIGSEFKTFASKKEAESYCKASAGAISKKKVEQDGPKADVVGLIIKTDVQGSSEAIFHEIEKLRSERLEFKILRTVAGDIAEDDIKLASSAAKPVVVGFRVNVNQTAKELAERMKVEIVVFEIIYEVGDFIRKKIEELAPPQIERKVIGKAKVMKIFPSKLKGQIIGGRVVEGLISRGSVFQLLRRGNKIADGKIENLQSGKINVPEVAADGEFGAHVVSKTTVVAGDILEVFIE